MTELIKLKIVSVFPKYFEVSIGIIKLVLILEGNSFDIDLAIFIKKSFKPIITIGDIGYP
ncbi:MAG: hypothetical protein H6613_18285 [Ignavibacteriales bacterium]|nr:hypothetical protein [Ignavibacteriales bacterium]